jgi:hypothetical protein
VGLPSNRWRNHFIAFVFALFLGLSLRQLIDHDVWFQLIAGREAFERMAVPKAEFYIYSALGEPSIFVGWLWGLLLYLAWLWGGYTAVSVFGAVVWAAVFAIAAKAMLAKIEHELPDSDALFRKTQIAAVLIATSVAYQYLAGRAVLRAEVSLYLVWVIAVYLSAGITADKQRLRRFLIAVPLLSWILGWLHTTSVFMVLLLVAHFLQACLDAGKAPGPRGYRRFASTDLRAWTAAILAAAVLPCLNPNGVEQAMPLITSLAGTLYRMVSGVHESIAEPFIHVNLEYRRLADVRAVWPAAILFLVSSLVVVWLDGSRRAVNAFLLSAGMLLSIFHIRALAVWAIFLVIPLGVAIAPLLQRAAVALESKGRGALVGGLIAVCCFWNIGTVFNKVGMRWGAGHWPSAMEEQLLSAIRLGMPNGGNIFNWHPLGAYLRWNLGSGFYVSMDGHLASDASAAWNAYFGIEDRKDDGLSLLDQWKIQAVYHPVVVPGYGDIHWLARDLAESRGWRLAAMGPSGVLFVRAGDADLDQHTRDLLKLEYWRRVVSEAKFVELVSGQNDSRERARKSADYAQGKIAEIQALLK